MRVEGDVRVAHRLVEAAGEAREERRFPRERLLRDAAAFERVVHCGGAVKAAPFHVQGDRLAHDAVAHRVRLLWDVLVALALRLLLHLRLDDRQERSEGGANGDDKRGDFGRGGLDGGFGGWRLLLLRGANQKPETRN